MLAAAAVSGCIGVYRGQGDPALYGSIAAYRRGVRPYRLRARQAVAAQQDSENRGEQPEHQACVQSFIFRYTKASVITF